MQISTSAAAVTVHALQKLNRKELIHEAKKQVQIEKEATLKLLSLLEEIERRKVYLDYGFQSLFSFCTRGLKLTESSAQRRILAMRLQRKSIEARSLIASGELTITSAAAVETLARRDRSKTGYYLEKAKNCSTKEFQKKLVEAQEAIPERESYRPVSSSQVELTITLDQETLDLIQELKQLQAHNFPHAHFSDHLKQMLKEKIQRLKKDRGDIGVTANPPKKPTVSISKFKKQNLFQKPRCEICGSKWKLGIDHIIPKANGGTDDPKNLRILCRKHNQRRLYSH